MELNRKKSRDYKITRWGGGGGGNLLTYFVFQNVLLEILGSKTFRYPNSEKP